MPDTVALYLCTWKDEDAKPDGFGYPASAQEPSRGVGTIDSQRELLRQYVEKSLALDGTIVEYADENYSGSPLRRPAFLQMIEDAKKGIFQVLLFQNITCVCAEEASADDYLKKIFPLLGIRVIIADSAYDSAQLDGREKKAGKTSQPLRGSEGCVFDPATAETDYYRREHSRRIRSGIQAKWEEGKNTASHLPYGYVKDKNAKGGWAVDPEAAQVVRQIFEKAGEGMQAKEIADSLNGQGIATPSVYREQREPSARAGNRKVSPSESLWDNEKVRSILTRYSYTGANVQALHSKTGSGIPLFRAEPEAECKIIENVHEAIVTREQYERAQALRQTRRSTRARSKGQYPLRGKVRCGVCSLAMSRVRLAGGDAFYCSHRKYTGAHSGCCSEYISAEKIEQAVRKQFRERERAENRDLGMTEVQLIDMGGDAFAEGAVLKSQGKAAGVEKELSFDDLIDQYVETVYIYNGDRMEAVFKQE